MNRRALWSVLAAATFAVAIAAGYTSTAITAAPMKAEEKDPAITIGPVVDRTLAPAHFIYKSKKTTFNTMMQTMGELLPPVLEVTAAPGVPGGTVVFIYLGADATKPDQEFELQVGYAIEGKVEKLPDGFKTRDLAEWKCKSVLITGPTSEIPTAYMKLIPEAMKAGYTGEHREYYLYWENEGSSNNVILINAGVGKKPAL